MRDSVVMRAQVGGCGASPKMKTEPHEDVPSDLGKKSKKRAKHGLAALKIERQDESDEAAEAVQPPSSQPCKRKAPASPSRRPFGPKSFFKDMIEYGKRCYADLF